MMEQLRKSIEEAEKVVIGIGAEFSVNFKELSGKDTEPTEYEKLCILESALSLRQDKAYQALKELIKDKDYFIISLNMDDAIFRTFDENDPIVTPCGGLRLLQCSEACCKDLYEAKKIPGYPFANGDYPVCPNCGKEMILNNLYAEHYLEEGYLASWEQYQDFLKSTINKKLCILELGCSLKFPTVVRFAFDKLAMYNKKSTFYRVHETLWQHAKETEGRGISVKENALSFLCKNA